MHFKKHQALLLFWLMLFGLVSGDFGRRFGLPYLFLDPEYLGKVNFLSFFIVGLGTGGFIMIWQISTYILHAWRFPFLAAVREPFIKFCINNSVLPIAFLATYIYNIIEFQHNIQFANHFSKFLFIEGFLGGVFIIILLTVFYFFSTNKNAFSWLRKTAIEKKQNAKNHLQQIIAYDSDNSNTPKIIRVDYYLNTPFHIRHTRNVQHYSKELLQQVYKQHYFNMLLIEISTIVLMLAFGSLMELPLFRIPAGASVYLCFSVITILIGAFNYWLRGWRTTIFILLFVLMNVFSKDDLFNSKNKFYGLQYDGVELPYNAATLGAMTDSNALNAANQHTLQILENWKNKPAIAADNKPYMVFLNVSGGGLRSAFWTFSVLQYLDSMTNGDLLQHTQLITGGSGGMLGASFFRELFYQRNLHHHIDLKNEKWSNAMATDLLNPIASTIAVNDLFLPWQSFTVNHQRYKKDRGYMFEKQFDENTFHFFDNKKLMDYYQPELKSELPMMILNGTIVNDGRFLMLSPQPLNYMVRPNYNEQRIADPKIDAVDFRYFFKTKQADSVLFTSALRMNCTFPYVLPSVGLPTNPHLDVMDAGVRDNYGFETSIRFLNAFRNWISANTAGVIFIQITDYNRSNISLENNEESALSQMINPITNVLSNSPEFQYYHQNNLLYLMNNSFPKNMYVLRFEYTPSQGDGRASLSFHLTAKEKQSIRKALYNAANQADFKKVKELVK